MGRDGTFNTSNKDEYRNEGETDMESHEQPRRSLAGPDLEARWLSAAPLCERLVESPDGREQCPNAASWRGVLHTGRNHFVSLACEEHVAGLIEAEPFR